MWQTVSPPGAAHSTSAAWAENISLKRKGKKSVSTLVALLSLTIWSWASLWGRGWTGLHWRYVSVIGWHFAQLGEFSSLACAAWQTRGTAPFFFFFFCCCFPPCRRQYHSSDLSPSACLNVWKRDVLRLLALFGKPGTLIPRPRGAWQYGAAWWPPASPGSRCHNTSHIASNQRLLRHTSITVAGMSDRSAKQPGPGVHWVGWLLQLLEREGGQLQDHYFFQLLIPCLVQWKKPFHFCRSFCVSSLLAAMKTHLTWKCYALNNIMLHYM